jgi:hypothetical protein
MSTHPSLDAEVPVMLRCSDCSGMATSSHPFVYRKLTGGSPVAQSWLTNRNMTNLQHEVPLCYNNTARLITAIRRYRVTTRVKPASQGGTRNGQAASVQDHCRPPRDRMRDPPGSGGGRYASRHGYYLHPRGNYTILAGIPGAADRSDSGDSSSRAAKEPAGGARNSSRPSFRRDLRLEAEAERASGQAYVFLARPDRPVSLLL